MGGGEQAKRRVVLFYVSCSRLFDCVGLMRIRCLGRILGRGQWPESGLFSSTSSLVDGGILRTPQFLLTDLRAGRCKHAAWESWAGTLEAS